VVAFLSFKWFKILVQTIRIVMKILYLKISHCLDKKSYVSKADYSLSFVGGKWFLLWPSK